MKRYLVKLVDTNGVVSDDRIFANKAEAEIYMTEQEKKSNGWELQIFEYPSTTCKSLV
ncbi:MAG: hypothetical protein ACOYJ1_04340 [Peptococcales bacterium]